MPRIDAFDEAVIDSPPLAVFKAILNEAAGVTHWWMPHWESKLRGDIPIDREGAIFDITIHGSGTPRFSGKIKDCGSQVDRSGVCRRFRGNWGMEI